MIYCCSTQQMDPLARAPISPRPERSTSQVMFLRVSVLWRFMRDFEIKMQLLDEEHDSAPPLRIVDPQFRSLKASEPVTDTWPAIFFAQSKQHSSMAWGFTGSRLDCQTLAIVEPIGDPLLQPTPFGAIFVGQLGATHGFQSASTFSSHHWLAQN